ncbi:MAG: YqaA family protein [Blastocatellia bacterium]|jgi:membrane protein YqaA with SNARE-associated domain
MNALLARIAGLLKATQTALVGLGPIGIPLISFLDAAMIPLPGGPDAVVMTLSHLNHSRMPLYVAAAIVGSTFGCLVPYYFGRRTGVAALRRFDPATIARVSNLIDRFDLGAVVVGALLPPPFPFKVFLISAGVFQMKVGRFLVAIAIGRTIRYSLEGWMAVRFGEQAADLFKQHYPRIGLAFALTIVVAFLLRYLLRRQRSSS